MLRVAGAPPVPKLLCDEPAHLPREEEKRPRRRWVLGVPVVLKTADGELLHMEPCRLDQAEPVSESVAAGTDEVHSRDPSFSKDTKE